MIKLSQILSYYISEGDHGFVSVRSGSMDNMMGYIHFHVVVMDLLRSVTLPARHFGKKIIIQTQLVFVIGGTDFRSIKFLEIISFSGVIIPLMSGYSHNKQHFLKSDWVIDILIGFFSVQSAIHRVFT